MWVLITTFMWAGLLSQPGSLKILRQVKGFVGSSTVLWFWMSCLKLEYVTFTQWNGLIHQDHCSVISWHKLFPTGLKDLGKTSNCDFSDRYCNLIRKLQFSTHCVSLVYIRACGVLFKCWYKFVVLLVVHQLLHNKFKHFHIAEVPPCIVPRHESKVFTCSCW